MTETREGPPDVSRVALARPAQRFHPVWPPGHFKSKRRVRISLESFSGVDIARAKRSRECPLLRAGPSHGGRDTTGRVRDARIALTAGPGFSRMCILIIRNGRVRKVASHDSLAQSRFFPLCST